MKKSQRQIRKEYKEKGIKTGKERYNKGIKEQRNNNKKGASPASPLTGERVPAIGDGECMIELDGENHRFPKSCYRLAEEKGWTIEQYVRWRHQ